MRVFTRWLDSEYISNTMIYKNNLAIRGAYVAPQCETYSMHSVGRIMILSNGVNYSDEPGGAGGNDTVVEGGDF